MKSSSISPSSTRRANTRRIATSFEAAAGRAATAETAAYLAAHYAAGVVAWPKVKLDPETFGAHLGGLVREGSNDGIEMLHGADLFLAAACLEGAPGAHRAFRDTFAPQFARYVARIDANPAFVSEVTQETTTMLLLGNDRRAAKISQYSGRGPLGAFIRVAAVRVAQDKKKAQGSQHTPESAGGLADGADDPELQLLKRKYARHLALAIKGALAELPEEERRLIKLHYIDGLSIDEVGARCNVSRATAARWLARARKHIADQTRVALAARIGASQSPASVLALVQSQLDMRLSKLGE
jgi:RNA polymerase sigma-70 factor, ECF subfamily